MQHFGVRHTPELAGNTSWSATHNVRSWFTTNATSHSEFVRHAAAQMLFFATNATLH